LIDEFLKCVVLEEKGDRVLVETELDPHTLMALERWLHRRTGRYVEILCGEKKDRNVLRRFSK
jgi:hypothetical protein